jgi:hypothetical protein
MPMHFYGQAWRLGYFYGVVVIESASRTEGPWFESRQGV